MTFYLGIDGGGTKTSCALGDETRTLASSIAGASNVIRVGEAQAREALKDLPNVHLERVEVDGGETANLP